MRYSILFSVILMAIGCTPGESDSGGTAVGNPGEAKVVMAVSNEVHLSEGHTRVAAVIGVACDPEEADNAITVDTEIALNGLDTLPVPEGTWCELVVELDDNVAITGEVDTDTSFELILSLPNNAIVMTQEKGVTVDETLFVWEIAQPHWIDVEALELTTDDHTVIDSTHPAHDHLTFGIQDQSGLYLDADEDGELSADERDAGTLASGDDRDADGDANDTEDDNSERGCNAVGGVPAWLLLAMAPLLRRRTRDSTR